MKIIEVRSDGRGGAIYSKPDPEQEKNILLILEKLKKDGGEKNGNNKRKEQKEELKNETNMANILHQWKLPTHYM